MTEATAGREASQRKGKLEQRVAARFGELAKAVRERQVLFGEDLRAPAVARRGCPGGGAWPARYFPVSRPLASGKYGRKASLRRTHSGSTSFSGWRCRRLYSFWMLTKRAAPARTAASASRICSTEKFEAPISRTLPAFTSPSSASRVSAIGVFGSGW